MAKLIRRDGETVRAYDDAVMSNYAFNGQSAILANIGLEMAHNISVPNQVRVATGMCVVQGRQVLIEQEEVITLQQAPAGTTYWYITYVEVDMSAIIEGDESYRGRATIKTDFFTNSFPSVPNSDNLDLQPNGKAYLGLFRFRQTNTGVIGLERIHNLITPTSLDETNVKLNGNQTVNNRKTFSDAVGMAMGGMFGGSANVAEAAKTLLRRNSGDAGNHNVDLPNESGRLPVFEMGTSAHGSWIRIGKMLIHFGEFFQNSSATSFWVNLNFSSKPFANNKYSFSANMQLNDGNNDAVENVSWKTRNGAGYCTPNGITGRMIWSAATGTLWQFTGGIWYSANTRFTYIAIGEAA